MTTEPADTLKEYRLMAARDAEAGVGVHGNFRRGLSGSGADQLTF